MDEELVELLGAWSGQVVAGTISNQLRLASHEKERWKKTILHLALASFGLVLIDTSFIHSHSIPHLVSVTKSNPASRHLIEAGTPSWHVRGCSSPTLEQLRLVGWVASC